MTDIPVPNGWTIRRALGWAVVPAIGFAVAFSLRYFVIQDEAITLTCSAVDAPGWCGPRQSLILWQQYQMWGWIALGSAAVALLITLPQRVLRIVLVIALLFSAFALALYNATLGALALVLTLLALLRR